MNQFWQNLCGNIWTGVVKALGPELEVARPLFEFPCRWATITVQPIDLPWPIVLTGAFATIGGLYYAISLVIKWFLSKIRH
jgi:hypothetical protein